MATRTSYLNLIKPNYTDAADIADINANMDTLDDKIKKIDSAAIDDTLVPTSDSGTIRNQLSQLANRIKAATGTVGWKDDPSTTLASLATLVSNLASGSDVTWDGKKFTNTKLGISGLMDTNGYVSFGKNFGGLIIQWGNIDTTSEGRGLVNFPLSYTQNCFGIYAMAQDTTETHEHISYYNLGKSSCGFYTETNENMAKSLHCLYFSVGY